MRPTTGAPNEDAKRRRIMCAAMPKMTISSHEVKRAEATYVRDDCDYDTDSMGDDSDEDAEDLDDEEPSTEQERKYREFMKQEALRWDMQERQQGTMHQQGMMQQQQQPVFQQHQAQKYSATAATTTTSASSHTVQQQPQMMNGFMMPVQWTPVGSAAGVTEVKTVQELSKVFECSKNVDRSKLYMIVYKRPGCPACVKYESACRAMHAQFPRAAFVHVNVTAMGSNGRPMFEPYMTQAGISAVPTFVFLKGCAIVAKVEGFGDQQYRDIQTLLYKLQ